MDANPPPCPGGCTEGAMCPGCFAEWQREAYARSLSGWLRSFGTGRDRRLPANDVLRPVAQATRPSVRRHSARA